MNLLNRRGEALALVLLALSPAASAQTGTFDWRTTEGPNGAPAAWAVKSEGGAGVMPQVMVLARQGQPGSAPSARTSLLMAFEVDCTARKARAASLTRFNADFVQTSTQPASSPWMDFSTLGPSADSARAYCTKSPEVGQSAERHDLTGAQRWLDGKIPQPIAAPTGVLTFEYGGPLNSSQPQDLWLETTTIKREGDTAKAWIIEVWEPGWQPLQAGTNIAANPASWSLQEFTCGASLKVREVWSAKLNGKLETTSSGDRYDQPRSAGDSTYTSIALRVCNNRPLLFSETIKADIRTLAASRYAGAGMAFGIGARSYKERPRPQPVDLGPTIRITQKDRNYSYVGAFTRESADPNVYKGQISFPDGKNSYPVTLTVEGIVGGQLMLRRDKTFDGQMAIPLVDGKPSGKGVYAAFRHDDAYSWSLVEPATVTAK